MPWESLFDVLLQKKDNGPSLSGATGGTNRSMATQPRSCAASWNSLHGDSSGGSAYFAPNPLRDVDLNLNRVWNEYIVYPAEDDSDKQDTGKEKESDPFSISNPLSWAAVSPAARTIYSVRRTILTASTPSSSPVPPTQSVQRCTSTQPPATQRQAASHSASSSNADLKYPSGSPSSVIAASGSSGTLDAAEEGTDTARPVDKGKGRAVEVTSDWTAKVETGDILVDEKDSCVDPKYVFGIEEEQTGSVYVDNEEDSDEGSEEAMESCYAIDSPVAGPSTSAAYSYGAGPSASARVEWRSHFSWTSNMNEGSSALGDEQPARLPSRRGLKRRWDADYYSAGSDDNDDKGAEEKQEEENGVVPAGPSRLPQTVQPNDPRMTDAAILAAYGGSEHPDSERTLGDFGCRVWLDLERWCCHFCQHTVQDKKSIERHIARRHYPLPFTCQSFGCLCGREYQTARNDLMKRHLRTDWMSSKKQKTQERKPTTKPNKSGKQVDSL